MTPVTPLCAQQSRKPTTEISLTCIHSVFSIMQCVSGEKKKCVWDFFFFFFKHGQQIKGARPLLVLSVLFFSLVCLFSLVCFKDLVVESPQATAQTVRPTVHLQGAEPPPKSAVTVAEQSGRRLPGSWCSPRSASVPPPPLVWR